MSVPLWPHQQEAIASAVRALGEGRTAGLWVMPTGTGKTRAFCVLACRSKLRTLVVVHRDELVQQTVTTLKPVDPEASVGVIQGRTRDWQDRQVVVATVQSLVDRLADIPPDWFDLVVLDEAHHAPARSWAKVVEHFRPRFLLGCTATPDRLDGKPLSQWFGATPLYTYGLGQAIADGYLVPVRQRAIRTTTSLEEVGPVKNGDFPQKALARAVNVEDRTGAIVEAHSQYASNRPTLVFGVNLEHVEQIRQAFEAAGVAVASVTGEMSVEDRRKVLADFRKGRYRVLVSCEVLTEGYDEPGIRCIIMARPTKSRALYQQGVGRGLRIDPERGKVDCLVLDVIDHSTRHQPVTAAWLFGAKVPDCQGRDVREVAAADRVYRQRHPLSPTLAQISRWESGAEKPWLERPDLAGYQATKNCQMEPATDEHYKALARFGFEPHRELTRGEANHLIKRCRLLAKLYPTPATPGQRWVLEKEGLWRPGMSKREAGGLIGWVR
jgi:superfamily II DNA or RNA helicase